VRAPGGDPARGDDHAFAGEGGDVVRAAGLHMADAIVEVLNDSGDRQRTFLTMASA